MNKEDYFEEVRRLLLKNGCITEKEEGPLDPVTVVEYDGRPIQAYIGLSKEKVQQVCNDFVKDKQ